MNQNYLNMTDFAFIKWLFCKLIFLAINEVFDIDLLNEDVDKLYNNSLFLLLLQCLTLSCSNMFYGKLKKKSLIFNYFQNFFTKTAEK